MELIILIIYIISGLLLLFAGYKLFWLFIGVIGFMFGLDIATYYFQNYSEWVVLFAALLAGLIGILLAIFMQRIAVIIAGVLVGSSMALNFYLNFVQQSIILMWISFLMGGIVGGTVFSMFFDWTLILFSALLGAAMLAQVLEFTPFTNNLIFLALFIIGVIIQVNFLKHKEIAPAG